MRVRRLHDWNLTPTEAVALQQRVAAEVVDRGELAGPRVVAAADVSYDREADLTVAGVALFTYPDLEPIEERLAHGRIPLPYVPGLLSFRETPLLIRCFERLQRRPHVVLVDGHGRAHPRRFGLACHLGVLLDVPTIGCAKSRLTGSHEAPGTARGDRAPLRDGDEVIGVALVSREGTLPIYVSVGHRIDLDSAVTIVLELCRRSKHPEPLRAIDRLVGARRRRLLASGWPDTRR